jgi:hypothetical protein
MFLPESMTTLAWVLAPVAVVLSVAAAVVAVRKRGQYWLTALFIAAAANLSFFGLDRYIHRCELGACSATNVNIAAVMFLIFSVAALFAAFQPKRTNTGRVTKQ